MKLVVLTDFHDAETDPPESGRRSSRSRLLLRRVVNRCNRFLRPDAVLIAGDVLDNGAAPDAPDRYRALREILDTLTAPWLIVPGNHDAETDEFYRFFPRPPDLREIGGFRFQCFCDPGRPGWAALRLPVDLARSADPGPEGARPKVALQHVPLFPPGARPCPYNYENAEDAIAAARRGGISLVLAGHYHKGFEPVTKDGVTYVAAPALCESPFPFLEIDIEPGRVPTVTRHELRMPDGLPLAESHVHTEFAYCAEDVTAAQAVDTARLFGVNAPALAEHSGQLYFDRDTFWSAGFMPDGLDTATGRQDRADAYLATAEGVGLPRSHIGFEADFDHRGRIVLDPRHRARAGYLIGSYHWTPESAARQPFDPAICAARLRAIWDPMLASGIDVLAHPFRLFARQPEPPPADLFADLARRLARAGVAAELNTHIEYPIPEFVTACLDAGVRLSLGTDSHNLAEVAEFWPHLRLLRGLGVRDGELDRILWRPGP